MSPRLTFVPLATAQSRRRMTIMRLWRFIRWRWREARAFVRAVLAARPAVSIPVTIVLVLIVSLHVNSTYHVIRNRAKCSSLWTARSTEISAQTWQKYRHYFAEHAHGRHHSQLLAALAQVEEAATPSPERYWRWRASSNPLESYQPPQCGRHVQITSGTFQAARRYCIHGRVAEDGPRHDVRSCWFNGLHARAAQSCDRASRLSSTVGRAAIGTRQARHCKRGKISPQSFTCAGPRPGTPTPRAGLNWFPGSIAVITTYKTYLGVLIRPTAVRQAGRRALNWTRD